VSLLCTDCAITFILHVNCFTSAAFFVLTVNAVNYALFIQVQLSCLQWVIPFEMGQMTETLPGDHLKTA